MRLAPPRLAVPVTMLVFALAGCGGATVAVQEVPGDPAQLEVPGNGEGLAPASTATATPTPTETPGADDAEATAVPDASGTTPETQSQTVPEGTDRGRDRGPDRRQRHDRPGAPRGVRRGTVRRLLRREPRRLLSLPVLSLKVPRRTPITEVTPRFGKAQTPAHGNGHPS